MDKIDDLIQRDKYNQAIDELYNNITNIRKLFDKQKEKINLIGKSDNRNQVERLRNVILLLHSKIKTEQLDGRSEINTLNCDVQYLVCIADTNAKIKLFILYVLLFKMEATLRTIYYDRLIHVGIDFEFVKGEISLMQYNFETLHSKKHQTDSIIWLVGPKYLTKDQLNILINDLYINTKIYKILHGSDSLDLPYIYYTLLQKNKSAIKLFTSKLIDTRYICEYMKINVDGPGCNIYDALKYFNTITPAKHKQLHTIQETMAPIYTIGWDVKKLTNESAVQYVYYDVLFLQQLLFDMYLRVRETDPDHVTTYRYINHFIKFVFMERRDVTNIVATIKPLNEKFNNTKIVGPDGKEHVFSAYYEQLIEKGIFLNDSNIDLTFILEIGYVRKIVEPLLKYTIYSALTNKVSIDYLYSLLHQDDYYHIIYVIFEELYRFILNL